MNRIRTSTIWIAATLLFTATQAFSQSTTFGFTYTFPRVEIPGMRLLIANVNNNAAIARVTLYNPDGTAAGSTRFTLEAAAQRIFDDSDVLVPNFIGAAVVETTIPVAASSAISTADVFETAAPSVSGLDLVIPFARTASVAETTVSVFNPGTQS